MKANANRKTDSTLFNAQLKSVTDVKSINVSRLLETSKVVSEFVKQNIPISAHGAFVINAKIRLNDIPITRINSIVDLELINFQCGQSYLQEINARLPMSGLYIGCVKVPLRRSLFIRKEKNAYGVAETLGRLVHAGFSIIDYKLINDSLYYCVMKTQEPVMTEESSRRWIIAMDRIGQHGDLMKVYKFRTMHPFSEYLQDFVIQLNGYNKHGKPANDFRLTYLGRFLRKYWVDELPQILNLLRGELSIVGVRPLSHTRFTELPEDVQTERVKFKPGCIPPYVSLAMPDDKGNIEAERIYFSHKRKSPYWTDIKFFFLAIYNIIRGRVHSA
ncbi:sugar transferase [Carboxylicivirga sp. N1Y90]|uniref:sugar transferase n=1 Tax=Carboxylicivirga fragile TaxID=3417571 RepID=UPI003D347E6A